MLFSSKTLEQRQKSVARAWQSILQKNEVIVVSSGDYQQKPGGLDQNYPFLPHPEYYWLNGDRHPRSFMTFHPEEGWTHFVHAPTPQDLIWEKAEPAPEKARPSSELANHLKKLNPSAVYELGSRKGLSTPGRQDEIQLAFDRLRRKKDDQEIDLIRQAARAAQAGYNKISEILRPGISERTVQIEFEAEIQRAGADGTPYDTIVGSGVNSAILHAIPTEKKILENELVLIDAGAQIADYCVDITRVFHSERKLSGRRKDLFDLVHAAQNSALSNCRAGVEWHQIHRSAARSVAEGLKHLGLVQGGIDDVLDSGAIALFFPHGVGHFVGLRVRDTGCLENKNPKKHCGVTLRIDLKLEERHLVTVEPGCYFIEGLLNNSEARMKFREFIKFDQLAPWMQIGGVRIEDDILILNDGYENLTGEILRPSV